jgi:hypothetical protein
MKSGGVFVVDLSKPVGVQRTGKTAHEILQLCPSLRDLEKGAVARLAD